MKIYYISKKQKIFAFGILFLLVAVLVVYSAVSYRLSKGNAVSRLQKAIINNDAKTAASLIKSSDKKLVINEENIKSFLAYLNKNPDNFKRLADTLHKQAASLDGKNDESCWNCYLTLKKSNKGFLGFCTYYFEMKPCYADIYTNYAFTKVYVDGKYVFTSASDSFTNKAVTCGPFVQGEHKVKAVCESLIGKSESSQSINFISNISKEGKAYNYPCSMAIKDSFTYVFCNMDDAEIFINGKDTGKTSSDIKELGPIDKNTSIKIYAEKNSPWGILKSDELEVDSASPVIILKFSINNNEFMNQLKSAVVDFNKTILSIALRTESIPPNVSESIMKKEYADMSSKGIHFSGNYLYSTILPDNISISYSRDSDTYFANALALDYYDQDYGDTNNSLIKTSINGVTNNYNAEYDVKSKKWIVVLFCKNK